MGGRDVAAMGGNYQVVTKWVVEQIFKLKKLGFQGPFFLNC